MLAKVFVLPYTLPHNLIRADVDWNLSWSFTQEGGSFFQTHCWHSSVPSPFASPAPFVKHAFAWSLVVQVHAYSIYSELAFQQ